MKIEYMKNSTGEIEPMKVRAIKAACAFDEIRQQTNGEVWARFEEKDNKFVICFKNEQSHFRKIEMNIDEAFSFVAGWDGANFHNSK